MKEFLCFLRFSALADPPGSFSICAILSLNLLNFDLILLSFGSAAASSTLSADTPSSFNLDFQTGVAANTLLFGTIRSVKWTQTELAPAVYKTKAGISLKKFTSDTITYSLGLGRKFSDEWSGAVTYGTEAAEGTQGGPLGPTDGYSTRHHA